MNATQTPWFFCKVLTADITAGLWMNSDTAARRKADGSFEVYCNRQFVTITADKAAQHLSSKRGVDGKPVRLNAHEIADLENGRGFSSN